MWKCSIPKGPKCYLCIIYHQHVKILSIIGITHCYSLIFLLTIINACIEKKCLFCLRLSCDILFKASCRREFSEFVVVNEDYFYFDLGPYKNCGEYNLMICYMYVSKSLYEDKLYPAFLTYLRP